jgi:hypothetical protein
MVLVSVFNLTSDLMALSILYPNGVENFGDVVSIELLRCRVKVNYAS